MSLISLYFAGFGAGLIPVIGIGLMVALWRVFSDISGEIAP